MTGLQSGSLIYPRELPAEWESRAEEEELEISVEDLTEENYVPKKKAFHPFSGRGYRLGRWEIVAVNVLLFLYLYCSVISRFKDYDAPLGVPLNPNIKNPTTKSVPADKSVKLSTKTFLQRHWPKESANILHKIFSGVGVRGKRGICTSKLVVNLLFILCPFPVWHPE